MVWTTTLTVGRKDWRLIYESKSKARLLIFLMNILAGEVFSPGLEKSQVVRRRWGEEEGMGWDGMEQVEQAMAWEEEQ